MAAYTNRQAVRSLTCNGGIVTLYAVWVKLGDPGVVLCLGDSITAGMYCYGLPYPSRLARLCGRSVKNYGKGGQTAAWGASVIEGALRREGPGFVCVLFGANDVHGGAAAATKENLRKIIRLCRQYHATPIIATPLPQRGKWARYNDKVRALANQIRSLAREESVPLVDLNSAFGDGSKHLNPSDGLHLNDAGGNLVAGQFNAALRQL
jgi:lysophospholipase L1-like esterase